MNILKKIGLCDKRIIIMYIIIFIFLITGITYALQTTSFAFNTDTAIINIDEAAYGTNTTLDTSNLDMKPIQDSSVTTSSDNVIKIDFGVKGASSNTTPVSGKYIYDVALTGLEVNCNLLSEYVKWKLIKNGEEISSGSLSPKYDHIEYVEDGDNPGGRLVLTDIQQDLKSNSEEADQYTFYMWVSDSCQECTDTASTVDQTYLFGKKLKGNIEIETYNSLEEAKERTKDTSTSIDKDVCDNTSIDNDVVKNDLMVLFEYNKNDTEVLTWNDSLTTDERYRKSYTANKTYGTLPSATKKITITYNSNGGSSIDDNTSDLTLAGWYRDNEVFNNRVDVNSTVINKLHYLYAKWNAYTIPLPTPTKAGYTFEGWYSDADLTNEVTSGYTTTESMTLYAKWSINTYILTINPNGGIYNNKTTNSTYEGNYGDTRTISAITGSNRPSYTITYDMNGIDITISKTSDKVYRAFTGWTKTGVGTITTNTPIETSEQTFTFGEGNTSLTAEFDSTSDSVTLPTLTKLGNTCTWNTMSDGTGTSYESGKTGYTTTGNITLYAICTKNVYTIAYKLNGGTSGTNAPTSAIYNEDVEISNPTKTVTVIGNDNSTGATIVASTGKEQTFSGWTSSTTDGLESNATTGTGASPTTSWTGTSTKNTYFKNLRDTIGTVTLTANWTAVALTLPKVTKTGYTCEWNTESDGSGTSYNSEASYTPSATSYAEVTMYAICSANTYIITLNNQTATTAGTTNIYEKYNTGFYSNNTATTPITKITIPTKTGYTFGGYYTSTNGNGTQYIDATGNITASNNTFTTNTTLYAKWTINTYTIAYNLNGGNSGTNAPTTGTYNEDLEISNPTKTGYTFTGWTSNTTDGLESNATTGTEASPTTSWTGTATTNTYFKNLRDTTGTVTLTANWTINSYYLDLNINVNDTSYNNGYAPDSTQLIYVGLKVNGVDKGYVSDYWAQYEYGTSWEIYGYKINGTTITTLGTNTVNGTVGAANTAITPKFYILTINSNNTNYGTVSSSSLIVPKGISYSTNSNVLTLSDGRTVTATATSATGYTTTFSSWSTTSATITAATTVTANFTRTAHTYNVVFNGNGNTSGSTATKTCTYDQNCVLTSNGFAKTNYTFQGWGTSSTATTVSYSNGATVKNLSSTNGATVNLYAIWLRTFTATFYYYNNASTTKSCNAYNSATSCSITSPAASGTPSGYTFRGWSTSNTANATINLNASTSTTISSSPTYYASYSYTVTAKFTAKCYDTSTSSSKTATAYMNYVGTKIGGSITSASAATCGGTDFDGWSTSETSLSGSLAANKSVTLTANTNYYAIFILSYDSGDTGASIYWWKYNNTKSCTSTSSSTYNYRQYTLKQYNCACKFTTADKFISATATTSATFSSTSYHVYHNSTTNGKSACTSDTSYNHYIRKIGDSTTQIGLDLTGDTTEAFWRGYYWYHNTNTTGYSNFNPGTTGRYYHNGGSYDTHYTSSAVSDTTTNRNNECSVTCKLVFNLS